MDRAYQRYRSTHVDHITGERATATTLQQIVPYLPVKGEGLIVELGCGNGEVVEALRELGFRSVLGVDASPDQVEAARIRGVDVELCDARQFVYELKTRSSAFLALDLLEHLDVDSLVELCEAILRNLEPRGVFIARLPNPQSPFGGALDFGDITHRTHLAPTAAQQVARLAGFADVQIHPVAPAVFGWRTRVRRLLWRMQHGVLCAMFSVEAGLRTQRVFSLNYLLVARKSKEHVEQGPARGAVHDEQASGAKQ